MKNLATDTSLQALKAMEFQPLPEKPLVSVLICSYNYEKLIGKTIESALNQTYKNIEIIVCDDGSADNSCGVVEKYLLLDSRVTLIRKENGGQASTLNRAFQESAGTVICILDADDLFAPRKIERVLAAFGENPEAGLVVHPIMLVDSNGTAIQPVPLVDNFEEGWLAERVVRRGGRLRLMPASTLSFRRELGRYIFPIPGRIFSPDGFICSLLPLFTQVAVVREILADYTMHDANSSSLLRDFTTPEKGVNTTVRYLAQLEEVITTVNGKLESLGIGPVRIDITNNLDYRIRQFSLYLLQGKDFLFLVKSFRSLAPILVGDTLYTPLQRFIFFSVYLAAIPLPAGLRMWCVGRLHPPNKL